jgi:peptidoglycan hydrolase CwlO-like protein
MEVSIDKRVTDIENIIGDIPVIMNYRFERFDTALRDHNARFDEINGRLNLLDQQMSMMLRDMRDLRGGVTRMLIAQDAEIASLKSDMAGLKTDFSGLKGDVSGLKGNVSGLKGDVAGLKADVAGLKADVAEIKSGIHLILARMPQA